MGMAPHQLGADATGHPGQIKTALLAGDAGMQHHLQQQIPQFLLQVTVIAVANRVRHLVGLLQHVGDEGAVGLLQIPGATGHRIAQLIHDGDQPAKVLRALCSRAASG
jgi:hypothetical protein